MSVRAALRRQGVLPLVGGVLASVAVPLALLFPWTAPGVPGLGGDPLQTLWRMRLMAEGLQNGGWPVAPEPFLNLGPLPWLPLSLTLGENAAYTLVWVLQFPLAMLCTMALGRSYGLGRGASALAGLLVAVAPYRIAQSLGHFGAMQLFWLPLTLLALRRWLRQPTASRALVTGFALVGTAWTEHTLFLTTLLACVVVALAARRDLRLALQATRGRISACVLALIVIAGAVTPFWKELAATSRSGVSPLRPPHEQRLRFAPTPSSLAAFSPFSAITGAPEGYGTPRETAADHVHALGIVLIACAVVSLVGPLRRQHPELWLLVVVGGLGGLLLSLVARSPLDATVFRLPILGALRTVDRFLALPVSLLPLAAAAAALRPQGAFRMVLAALLVLEVLPGGPFPRVHAHPTPLAREIADASGAVLVVPAATDYLVASRALYDASFHRRPLAAQSAFARVADDDDEEKLYRVPGLRDVLLVRRDDLERPTFFGQSLLAVTRHALLTEGIGSVIVVEATEAGDVQGGSTGQLTLVPSEDIERVRDFLRSAGVPEIARAGPTTLHRVPPLAPGETGAVFVQRAGWARPSRRKDGVTQVGITTASLFEVRLLGSYRARATFEARIAAGSHAGVVAIHGPEGTVRADARPGGVLRLPLGVVRTGTTPFQLSVDGPEIIVENPTIALDLR